MMHNNAHIVAVDVSRRNDVTFQKTLSVNDWYHDGGDGYPLGALQLIGKVQGVMMQSGRAAGCPGPGPRSVARRSVEWLLMAEDLPSAESRVMVDGAAGSSRGGSHAACHAPAPAGAVQARCSAPQATTRSSRSPSTSA